MKTLSLVVLLLVVPMGAAACSGASFQSAHVRSRPSASTTTAPVAGTPRRGGAVAAETLAGDSALARGDARVLDVESAGGGGSPPLPLLEKAGPPAPIDTGDPVPRVLAR